MLTNRTFLIGVVLACAALGCLSVDEDTDPVQKSGTPENDGEPADDTQKSESDEQIDNETLSDIEPDLSDANDTETKHRSADNDTGTEIAPIPVSPDTATVQPNWSPVSVLEALR